MEKCIVKCLYESYLLKTLTWALLSVNHEPLSYKNSSGQQVFQFFGGVRELVVLFVENLTNTRDAHSCMGNVQERNIMHTFLMPIGKLLLCI